MVSRGYSLGVVHGLLTAVVHSCCEWGCRVLRLCSYCCQALRTGSVGFMAQGLSCSAHIMGSSWTRDRACVSCVAGGFFTIEIWEIKAGQLLLLLLFIFNEWWNQTWRIRNSRSSQLWAAELQWSGSHPGSQLVPFSSSAFLHSAEKECLPFQFYKDQAFSHFMHCTLRGIQSGKTGNILCWTYRPLDS